MGNLYERKRLENPTREYRQEHFCISMEKSHISVFRIVSSLYA